MKMIRKKPEREAPFTIIDYHTSDIVSSVIFQFVRKFFSPWSAQPNQQKKNRREIIAGRKGGLYV
jgi:hypothetical protein